MTSTAALNDRDGRARRHARASACREPVDVPLDLLGSQRDGRERILDLVRDAARDFLPRALLLRAQQFGRVLKHEHVADVLGVRRLSSSATVTSKFSGPLGACISISPEAEPMRWLRRISRSSASISSAGIPLSIERPRKAR